MSNQLGYEFDIEKIASFLEGVSLRSEQIASKKRGVPSQGRAMAHGEAKQIRSAIEKLEHALPWEILPIISDIKAYTPSAKADIERVLNYIGEFSHTGGIDDIENYFIDIVEEKNWEIPDSFIEQYSIWRFISEYLEPEYVELFENYEYETDIPGMEFGEHAMRLNKSRLDIRAYSRKLIDEICESAENDSAR